MFYSNTYSVEKNKHNNKPIKPLCFHDVAYPKPGREWVLVTEWKVNNIIFLRFNKKLKYNVVTLLPTYLNRFSAVQNCSQAPLFLTFDFK